MRADQAVKTRIGEYVYNCLYEVQEKRATYSWRWAEMLRYYMNHIFTEAPPGMDWMHTEMRQDIFDLSEGFVPDLHSAVFNRNQPPIVDAHTDVGEEIRDKTSAALMLAKRRAHVERKSVPAMRMLTITGHITTYNYWHREYGQKQVPIFSDPVFDANGQMVTKGRIIGHEAQEVLIHNGPATDFPDQRFVWKSMERDWLGRPYWWIQMFPLNLDMAEWVNQEYRDDTGTDMYSDLKNLSKYVGRSIHDLQGMSINPGESTNFWAKEESLTQVSSWVDDSMQIGKNEVFMLKWSGFIPKMVHPYDDTQWRQIVLGPDGTVHRDQPYPSHDFRPTLHDVPFIQVADEAYGRTPLEWCINTTVQRSELRNLRLADIWMNVMPQFVAKRDVGWDQTDFIKMPYGIWMYDDDEAAPKDVIDMVPRSPVLQEQYIEDNAYDDQQSRTMGVNRNDRGDNYGQRTSAWEASNINAQTNGRAALTAKCVSWDMEQTQYQDYFGLMQTFGDESYEVMVEGRMEMIHPSELQYNADISVDTADFGPMNHIELQGMQQLLGTISQNNEWLLYADPKKAIPQLAHRLGMASILRDKREVEAIMEAANQMNAETARQMQIEAQAGGPPI